MERYKKSTMVITAENIYYHAAFKLRPQQLRLALHCPSPQPTAISRQIQTYCSNSTIIGIG